VSRKTKPKKSGIDHNRTPIHPVDQPLSPNQVTFLQRVVAAIPRLFAALEEGNVKSELILGLRRVKSRQARLKLVAELVDPGANPLETHGSRESEDKPYLKERTEPADRSEHNTTRSNH